MPSPPLEVVLVRHGEVDNPEELVYGSLPGFGLSDAGRQEAHAVAARLAERSVIAVTASPLLRARQTAAAIAEPHNLDVGTDARLTEWALSDRWAGVPWAEVDRTFPGELQAYWRAPDDLPFAPESLAEVARRVVAAVTSAAGAGPGRTGCLVFVSHQDPVQAARLVLTGRPLTDQHTDKPGHAAAISLHQTGSTPGWVETEHWSPGSAKSGPPHGVDAANGEAP